jgi:hypothetical protein
VDAKLKAGFLAAIAVAVVVALGLGLLGDDGAPDPVGPRHSNGTDSPPPPDSQPPTNVDMGDEPTNDRTDPDTGDPDTGDVSDPSTPSGGHTRNDPRPEDAPAGSASAVFRCLDGTGQPLSGVRIEARRASGAPLTPILSDGSGEARLDGLVAGEAISGVGRHAMSRDGATFGPARVGDSAIVLRFRPSALGELRGILLNDAGRPVPEAELVLINPKSPEGQAVLDALAMALRPDGSFVARVAVGTYTVSARAPGLSESDRTYVTVSADGASRVSIVLNRQGSISGSVMLPPELVGNLPRTLELVWEVKAGTVEHPYTRNGRLPLEVGSRTFILEECDPGRYRLRLEANLDDGDTRVGNWSTLDLKAGDNVNAIKLALTEAVVAVKGTIKDDMGTPLAGVTVRVGAQQGISRDDGTYALRGLDLGETFLEAKLEGYAPGFLPIHYRAQALTVDIVMNRNGGVRGEVRDSNGPAARTLVLVIQQEDDGVRTNETKTDGQGYYQLEDLSPGSYVIKAGPGADPFTPGGAKISIRPGEIADVPPVGLDK